MRFARPIFIASLVFAAAPPALAAKSPIAKSLIAKGHAIAATYCGRCHAIGPGDSPHPDAPPFHEILGRLSLDNLEDVFSDAVASHAEMAHVVLSHGQLEALASYVATIK
ncbi:cytochrome c [Methylosinus sp. Sm6]|uniref:c-type cytochrome n=1 Tax=Methylosinus sp. Sm6 TaxID=2866948 RepID=UPI001C99B7BA|nr:cytochrome c [Methylosinus sp. Sm6]MBY6240801.1 cytochrome c [Methylosinus sp. Sm6]